MEARIQALNVEIKKLKDQVVKVNSLLSHENFAYNLLESQFEQIRARNQELSNKNTEMEVKIQDAMRAADKIMEDARKYEDAAKTNAMVLAHKAQAKYKEVESALAKAEKKQIENHLKDLETMAG
jgi:chromosome segregation ATPase